MVKVLYLLRSLLLFCRSMFIFNFFGGFFCMAMMFVDKEENQMLSIIFPLAGKFALTGGYGGIYVYSAELFPTNIR